MKVKQENTDTQSWFLTRSQIYKLFIALSWWYFKTHRISCCFSFWLVTFHYTVWACVHVCSCFHGTGTFKEVPLMSSFVPCVWLVLTGYLCAIGWLTQLHLTFIKTHLEAIPQIHKSTSSAALSLSVCLGFKSVSSAHTGFPAFSVITFTACKKRQDRHLREWAEKRAREKRQRKEKDTWNIFPHKNDLSQLFSSVLTAPSWFSLFSSQSCRLN